jgi:hypothetical protein
VAIHGAAMSRVIARGGRDKGKTDQSDRGKPLMLAECRVTTRRLADLSLE